MRPILLIRDRPAAIAALRAAFPRGSAVHQSAIAVVDALLATRAEESGAPQTGDILYRVRAELTDAWEPPIALQRRLGCSRSYLHSALTDLRLRGEAERMVSDEKGREMHRYLWRRAQAQS